MKNLKFLLAVMLLAMILIFIPVSNIIVNRGIFLLVKLVMNAVVLELGLEASLTANVSTKSI